MAIPAGYRRRPQPSGFAVVRDDLAALAPEQWWAPASPLPGASGRGGLGVLDLGRHGRAVARTLRRGGALRRLCAARFLWPWRVCRELAALVALRRCGVPAVEPLAALARRRGPLFELRLVTQLIEGGMPLPAFLAAHPGARRAAVRAAGAAVRAAFDAGLLHRDLHPDNLLAAMRQGEPAVWVLDLDRARLKPGLSRSARDRMLLRLARYLERHAADLPLAVRAVDRVRFLAGMGWARAERRREVQRLQRAYRRAICRHRLSWGRLSG